MSDTYRIDVADPSSGTYLGLISLNQEVTAIARKAGIPRGLAELLKVRASQLNGCAHSMRACTEDAAKAGEDRARLSVLPAWRRTGLFTPMERGALGLAEAITALPGQDIPPVVIREARSVLTEQQYIAVTWITMMVNMWNRIAMLSGYPVEK
ncbi:carboxymuconolactone decarboxylase family protein [Hoyosella subflava]|uniref:Alkylhydroperoxidase AhpD core n=1 Tax=Hoyosella subflava (strain DSM 45089 / JCM 17490 / NBRC 109087 / DQS3-9A1) TaxID=443218 RepID=F6EQQ7_HOYSD|nr:carboxymuconolactone decarboxylase family protein [Hoyosella subflava]AEF41934.1 Alkylhydroperoxidase AhpD core [Hoyosella subflava DQS3-9A1]